MDITELLPIGGLLFTLTILAVITHPRVYALLLGFEPRRTAPRNRSYRRRYES